MLRENLWAYTLTYQIAVALTLKDVLLSIDQNFEEGEIFKLRATIMCDRSQCNSNIYLMHGNLNELDISLQLQSKCVFPKTLAVLMIL